MKIALAIGSAKEVWDEVRAAHELCDYDEYYVCKMTGIEWDMGRFHWVTLHPEYMAEYKRLRRERGLPDCYEVVAPLIDEIGRHHEHPVDRRHSYRFEGMTSSGASGLFAVKVALDDGADRVVCAGIPMLKDSGHFFRGKPWEQVDSFRLGWERSLPHIKDKVRSLSGWTKELLGMPTPEWLSLASASLDQADRPSIPATAE